MVVASSSPSSNTKPLLDVCIIGAGPAGLACLSAIQEPYSLDNLNDAQVGRALRHKPAFRRNKKILVIDPHPCWMMGWQQHFRALDIKFLRSPALAHPDMFDQNALLAFAQVHSRQDELLESGCFDLRQLLPLGQTQIGLWKLPSLDLFTDFCQDLVRRLAHEYLCGTVVDVRKNNSREQPDGSFEVCLANGETVYAKNVILTMGTVGTPNIPPGLQSAPRLISWTTLDTAIDKSWSKVLVVGGGLTAVQAAQRLIAENVGHVTLCSRRPLVERHFDLAVEWFDRRTTNKCMSDFYHQSHDERLRILKESRGGGSVPCVYMKDVRCLEREGKLRCVVGHAEYEADAAACQKNQGTTTTKTQTACALHIQGSSSVVVVVEHYDAIVLACGKQPDCQSHPLCAKLLKTWPLPVVGGLPCLSPDASCWTDNFFVVGGLASLSVGPDAGNLMGMRRAAEIVANALHCRCWLRTENVLQNPFDIFMDDDDDDDSTEDESESAEESSK